MLVSHQVLHCLASPLWESTLMTPPAYLSASVASRDLPSFQLGSRAVLPLSQATPCACHRATMVWVAHSPPHYVASVLIRESGSFVSPQQPNCLFPGMLFLLTPCLKWHPPSPPPHIPTFLLEQIFLSYLPPTSVQPAALLSRAMSSPCCPAHTQPWLPSTETRKRRFSQR